ncbi:hypothetical protein AAZU54_01130 [Pseudomonas sp. Je.1.5.c]|uniref:hypothetical protein n=1 Tax=Pseudomonas sp. Je.1.5.c TaxID=3142839 RepID=UPI003DA98872
MMKSLLPIMAAMAMTGCMTAERMPDGTTKIRFSDEAANSLASLIPNGVVPGRAHGVSASGLDLNYTMNPLNNGTYLYLNGQFEYDCAAAMLYSAKSGQPLEVSMSNNCRSSYLMQQEKLRMAGKPYDRGAPAYDPANPPHAYWAKVVARTKAQLAAANQFNVRFAGYPRLGRNGKITIRVQFMGAASGEYASLVTIPERTEVVLDDPQLEVALRNQSKEVNTVITQVISCDAVLDYNKAVDKGPRPAAISPGEYSRYEVRFVVNKMGCKDHQRQFYTVNR